MMQLRKSEDRGFGDHGWLKSRHSFSFADYYDPGFMGWGNLRVINEDRIIPGAGFPTHGHRDMEIISVILSGELAHKDSMGNVESIPQGDIQRMSAGRGVTHSEFNNSRESEAYFLQIWIEPNVRGIEPSYEQKSIPRSDKLGQLRLVLSPDGAGGSIAINADARMYAGIFEDNGGAVMHLDASRKAYVHLVRGALVANGEALAAGDALMLAGESRLELAFGEGAEVLVFDLSS
jgi:redox-sensitive bicupin YhaK (pirin superfamily)